MACRFPFNAKKKITQEIVPVPCGYCPDCLKRRSGGWAFRLEREKRWYNNMLNYFVTLTYAPETVPISRNGFLTLDREDTKHFNRTIRTKLRVKKLLQKKPKRWISCTPYYKYYICGEYGGRTGRPHYHAIIFGATEEQIRAAWPHGEVHIDTVNNATIAYVAKYMLKGKFEKKHENDDRIPEFSQMSKFLGVSYLDKQEVRDHHQTRNYITKEDGVKMAMPRYYKDKLYTDQQKKAFADQIEKEQLEVESQRQEEYIRYNGSLEGYTYKRWQEATAELKNTQKEQKHKRQKV